jgi:hypothetical protein
MRGFFRWALRALQVRTDLDDLYRTTHTLRLRLNATEAMVVALAWTHPDSQALLERIHEWMSTPSGEGLSESLRDIQQSEHKRVTTHWQSLICGTPVATPATWSSVN